MEGRFMEGWAATVGVALLGVGLGTPAAAADPQGVFAPAASRVDVVHDSRNQLVVVSQGGELLLFDDQTGALVDTLVIGGELSGMDISADGKRLAVADRAMVDGQFRVHFVDLDTMGVHTVDKPVDWVGVGAFTVAFDAEDALYVTGRYAGPLYRIPSGSESFEAIDDVMENTMLRASGDRNVIAFAESGISDGRWGAYYPTTGVIVRRQWYEHGTSWFNYEMASNHDGSQFAIPTYGGAYIYDGEYQKIDVLGTRAGPAPVGVVYHPVEPLVFFPWAETQDIRVFDSESLTQVGQINVGHTFEHPLNNRAFLDGRLRLSDDGSLLMATVAGGVRIVPLYTPLSAGHIAASTGVDTPVEIPLQGSIGNSGSLSYRLADAPTQGEAWVEHDTLVYVPEPGFQGEVRMSYEVVYGLASRAAEVTIRVSDWVLAQDDRYVVASTRPLRMPVMDNDSAGGDGDMAIVAFTQPAFGSVSQDGEYLVFTDTHGGPRQVEFTYTIGNAGGATDQATVRILRVRR